MRAWSGGSANSAALAYVVFALFYSAAVGAAHATSLGRREFRLPAAFFGAIAGLVALAAGVRILWTVRTISVAGAIAAGAIYGAFLWLAIGAARRAWSIDVERFRVK